MTLEQLEERVLKAKQNVEAQKKTIERHNKIKDNKEKLVLSLGGDITKEASEYRSNNDLFWAIIDYKTKQDDIKNAQNVLIELENTVKNWEVKLQTEQDKEKYLEEQVPQVIHKFIDKWKEKAKNWYLYQIERHQTEIKEIYVIYEKAQTFNYGTKERKELMEEYDNEYKRLINCTDSLVLDLVKRNDRNERLEAILTQEARAKKIDLVTRVSKFTGKITDASNLSIGNQSGELNGLILGEDGKAKVETISAGGYNIQCYHFRVLVKEIK